MAIIRAAKSRNYSIIHNHIIKDNRLSWKAKGIFFYAMSRPDEWCFFVSDIVNHSKDGCDSVRAGLKELQEAGYLRRSKKRDLQGKFSEGVWIFYETPNEPDWENHPDPKPHPDTIKQSDNQCEPRVDFPHVVSPDVVNPTLLNTDLKQVLKAASRGGCPPPENPPAAAAFSDQKKMQEKQQQKIKICKGQINPLLAHCEMPESDKAWISERYDDLTIRNALSWAEAQPTIGNIAATLKFGCRERCSPVKSKVQMHDENRKYAKQFDGLSKDNTFVCSLSNFIEINFGACQKDPIVISYEDRHFKGKLDEVMEKYRLVSV